MFLPGSNTTCFLSFIYICDLFTDSLSYYPGIISGHLCAITALELTRSLFHLTIFRVTDTSEECI
jgi:hypothetical protein